MIFEGEKIGNLPSCAKLLLDLNSKISPSKVAYFWVARPLKILPVTLKFYLTFLQVVLKQNRRFFGNELLKRYMIDSNVPNFEIKKSAKSLHPIEQVRKLLLPAPDWLQLFPCLTPIG